MKGKLVVRELPVLNEYIGMYVCMYVYVRV